MANTTPLIIKYNSNVIYTAEENKETIALQTKDKILKDNITITLDSGGTDTSDATASASDILSGKTAYGSSGKLTGTIASKAASDVTASDNTVTVPAGYYAEAVTKTVGTKKTAQTYTPGTTDQTIASGQYLTGAQIIKGDANLVAENIKKDVEIFGITGTCGGGTTLTLFAPVISISEDTLTIAPTNGAFAEGFYIYANGTLLTTVQTTTVDLSSLAENGDIITAKAYGTNFNDSAASNSVEYVKIPIGVNWATDSWASIQKTSKQGKTTEIYGSQVGATREITLTNGNTMTIRLSNATDDMYSLSDGSRTTGLCMEFVDCFPDAYAMSSSNTNVGGWKDCQMRTVKMAQLYDLLPDDLKAVIATVDIKASSGGVSAKVATSQDQLFLLAEREIFATRNYSLQAEWDALTRWQWYADHDTAADRVKKRNGSVNNWWERSARKPRATQEFCIVDSSGATNYNSAGNALGVSPAFCI